MPFEENPINAGDRSGDVIAILTDNLHHGVLSMLAI
jgi:hypothetical protein